MLAKRERERERERERKEEWNELDEKEQVKVNRKTETDMR